MKPTSPEDRELEQISSEVSERYRAGAEDEPPVRLDAAILSAARREVEQPRKRRHWQVPVSIAAMLVIGVSLVLLVRENEPPLPSLDRPASEEAKLAKPAAPQLAMKAQPKAQPKARADSLREDRPSRERSARPARAPAARDEAAATQENTASGTVAPPASAPAAPVVAGPAKSTEQEQSRIAGSSDSLSGKKAGAVAGAATESRPSAQALRKEDAAAPAQPRDWLEKIDGLLRDGRQAEARRQLLGFRQQFPHYPLPERLQELLPPDQR
jgi:hypothetical protein